MLVPVWQRSCVFLWDKVYTKPAFTCHVGNLFGKAADYPDKLAKPI